MRITARVSAAGASIAALVFVAGVLNAPGQASGAAADPANACSNPVLAENMAGWGHLDGGATSRRAEISGHPVAKWAFSPRGLRFFMPELRVAPGQTWTVSADDKLVSGSPTNGSARMVVEWYNAANRYIGESPGPVVTVPLTKHGDWTWTRIAATVTVPPNAKSAHVLQVLNFGQANVIPVYATACDYRLGGTSTTPTTPPSSDQAAVRYHWGTPNPAESDEFNGTSVDLAKWGLFGASPGDATGCSPGFDGHGRRCGSQTTEGGGRLSVTGTADGVTGGLYSNHGGFKYGRVEVRERALPLADNGGAPYHAVPLLFPVSADYSQAEIDFAERDVADPAVELFVHHDGTQDQCSLTIDSTEFHNYAIDWAPHSVTWYVDGERICTVNASIDYFDTSNGGAQMDMFPETGTLMRPAREDVDWIRMYPTADTQYS
ncbi:glycoside hydrolase family 16 protein [Amycolatopsis sp. NPDC059657]|uniref:glycoside hydrolase family 16 protein n=1 Tax=Amycolatopsis sp. NPDC059657 TaxID=3346899 RepID=UPI00366BFA41